MSKTSKTGVIGIILTIIILIVVVIFSNSNLQDTSSIGRTLGTLVMPIQNGLVYLKNKVKGNNTFFTDLNNIKQENQDLKDKNSQLEQQLRELEIIKAENSTLKEYLNLSEKYTDYTTVPASVINKDTSNFSNVIVIDVGDKDGVKPKMVVISDEGLVGYVISTTKDTAKVQTILDPASSVSATLSGSRDSVICKGDLDLKSEIKITYIPVDATILEGDSVETSGMGGIYPRGIHIGKVDKIADNKNSTDRTATVIPAVDINKVESVLVITK